MKFIPYGRQSIDDDDIEAVASVLRGDFLTTGPKIKDFEAELCNQVGAEHAVVCSSGTAALHLAMLGMGLGAGDVAIVPSITFAATANAVRYVGAEVIFSDVDPANGLMRPQDLENARVRAAGRKVRVVLPVLLAGQGPDAAELAALASANDIAVVEDASHAIGARYQQGNAEWRVGACGHSRAAIFSFHPVKTVTMGEGGAVTTGDSVLADRMRRFRSHGIENRTEYFADQAASFESSGTPKPWYYELAELGFNYRATDIQCALGITQLRKLQLFVARRAVLVARYDQLLADYVPQARPIVRTPSYQAAWHLYVVQIDFASLGRERAAVMNSMRKQGIGTQVHYIPLHLHPYYRDRYGSTTLRGAEQYYSQALSLPLYPGLTEADQDRVVSALADALRC